MKKKPNAALGEALTPLQRSYVTEYVSRLATVLRLRDWTIQVNLNEPAVDGAHATNEQDGHARHCEIKFSSKFLDLNSKAQTQVLVHELMHCHLFELHVTAVECMEAASTSKTAAVFDAAITAQVEYSTDALADAFTPLVEQFELPAQASVFQHVVDLTKV